MKIIFIIIVIFFPLNLLSCDVVDTEEQKAISPGTRQYEWKIISLKEIGPNNLYSRLAGSSNNEIWISSDAGDFDKTILKYNGIKVSPYGSLSIDPSATWGFDSTEIWFTGKAFDFWRFNGRTISRFSTHMLNDYYNSLLVSIWGNAKYNIYSVGSGTLEKTGRINGIIMHYDGNTWNHSINPEPDVHFFKISKGLTDDKFFLVGCEVKPGLPDSYGFYEFDGTNIKRFNLPGETSTNNKNIALMGDFVFLNNDKEIYKIVENQSHFYISLKNTKVNGTKIWGRNEKDFFMQTIDGIGHYNGTNLETLFSIQGEFGILDGLVLASDIYFVGFNRNTLDGFLIHGSIVK